MAALLKDGETLASWIFDPLHDRMAVAELGGGAWVNGERIHAPSVCPSLSEMRGVISEAFAPISAKAAIKRIDDAAGEILPSQRCAGHEYPLVASGSRHFILYWRTLVWDHAPGALFIIEAGGVARRQDGGRYRPGEPGPGMLLAQNEGVAEEIMRLLHTPQQAWEER
jgi:fructose-1,6-bisphosphatase/inositol monophosphatase family enzyme